MAVVIKGKNINLQERTKNYIEKKVAKFERFLPTVEETRVELATETARSRKKDRYIAEITVKAKGKLLRSEERNIDLHTAIDGAVNKMNNQIVRVKGKMIDRWHSPKSIREADIPPLSDETLEALAEEQARQVVRVKQFSISPMDEDEAMEQMQLIDHNFFVFFNGNTGRVNVLYQREDGDYGLLDPVVA